MKRTRSNAAEKQKKQGGGATEIVNIRVPKELILELDALVKRRVFNSRSEAIREFAREYVQEQTPKHVHAKSSERGGGRW